MASTALNSTVFAFWLFFPCIFINYCDYRVNHREFLWLVVASQCQMSSDINILYHSYQEWLHYQMFTAFQCIFHIFVYFGKFAKRDAQSKAWDILLVLTSVAGNLCNKCQSSYSNKTPVKVILSMLSLVSIKQQSPRRPCDKNLHQYKVTWHKTIQEDLHKVQITSYLLEKHRT